MKAVKNNVPALWILFLKGENQRSFLSKASMKKPYKGNYMHLPYVQKFRVLRQILAFQARFVFGPAKSAWESLVPSTHQELEWWFNSMEISTQLRKSPQFWFPRLIAEYYACPIAISRRKGQCIWKKRDIMSSGWSRNLKHTPTHVSMDINMHIVYVMHRYVVLIKNPAKGLI